MDVTSLDGRGFAKFLTAGTYFLRTYRSVLNDLNVFPVPDGDTGTNMYLTARAAMLEAGRLPRGTPLSEVAAAAANGSLMGARGNSGVIVSQMLRGFAHHVRHRREIDTFMLATGMREAAAAARAALLRPVEGTILSVAEASAEAAYRLALHERDFYRLGGGIVRAANEALDRTPEQLPPLKEAGVVDAGGAGFVYFIEGILRFLPESKTRATAFPRREIGRRIFTAAQAVGEHKFCTEFVLEDATCTLHDLRAQLEPRGESLIVIGAPPTIKVHVHTDNPDRVQEIAAKAGRLTRVKVEDMERQHQLLVVDAPATARSIVAVVPGPGFERIARELGAEVVVNGNRNPSVRDLLLAVNKTLGSEVYLFANDKNVVLAAKEVAAMTDKHVHVLPTPDIVGGIAGLFAMRSGGQAVPTDAAIMDAAARVRSAMVFYAGKSTTFGGVRVERGRPAAIAADVLLTGESLGTAASAALDAMGASKGGLVTLYYGGAQREKDAQRLSEELGNVYAKTDVEYYYGGMKNAEYWISLDE
ncbi:MAG TPA: DAK2 domain-containing protein [Candidatus Baltobacteraceae bacterium]|nr:DAK2 domain-containing protein [Candidatus Baltobacteraceae bacterium]